MKYIKTFTITMMLFLLSCRGNSYKEADFVGTWRTTRTNTPINMYSNMEWEIKDTDGTVLQYGVWSYKGGKLIWSYKAGSMDNHDVNPVLSMSEKEFKVREADKSVTTFYRVD